MGLTGMVGNRRRPSCVGSIEPVKNRTTLVSAAAVVVLVLAATFGVACGGAVKRPDGGFGLLPAGAAAPEVVGRAPNGDEVRLSALRGKAVVVYFYPQDETPGCTKEACAFRDAWKDLERADIAVLGVSGNSEERHRAFQQKHQLPFPLASDDSGTIGTSYGVSKKLWGYDRVSFLVGRDGRVAHVWPSVDPGVHAHDVIDRAARLP
jgi:thioredoxin-dependent peroxiredoxin